MERRESGQVFIFSSVVASVGNSSISDAISALFFFLFFFFSFFFLSPSLNTVRELFAFHAYRPYCNNNNSYITL